ncbi:MAG: 3-deoxy-D-manno-octulosonic acid transferase [Acidobacteriota bacterium]
MIVWKIIYNTLIVPLLLLLFKAASLVNEKIRRGIRGRASLFPLLEVSMSRITSPRRVWFHASSLGEFEQAKPIITAIKARYPNVVIIATFFSPSGYDHSRNYKPADVISYLPFDRNADTQRFLEIVRPTIAVMVRYDIWPNMVWNLNALSVPLILANATLKDTSPRLWPGVRQFHRSLYDCFTTILTVSESDAAAFRRFNTSAHIEPIGDTRFDQVNIRSKDARHRRLLPDSITKGKKIFIIGQSWPEDEEVLLPELFRLQEDAADLLAIIVPHEPTEEHLDALEARLSGSTSFIRFSEVGNYANERCIIVDSVGVLVPLYQYAHIVYIGGSFRQGIHNVLEPAIFGVPVIFGPRHTNSQEAVALASRGGAFVIVDEQTFSQAIRPLLEDEERRRGAGEIARTFVESNCGATERCMKYFAAYLP